MKVPTAGFTIRLRPIVVLLLAACTGADGLGPRTRLSDSRQPVSAPAVAQVSITPNSPTAAVASPLTLAATAYDRNKVPIPGVQFTWTSGDRSVAAVDGTGLVNPLSVGRTTIFAAAGGSRDSVILNVRPEPVSAVEVAPVVLELLPGDNARLAAIVHGVSGRVLSGRSLSWWSNSPAVASVDSAGNVVALGPGNATIGAAVEDRQTAAQVVVQSAPTISVSVTPATASVEPGNTLDLTAAVYGPGGRILNRPVTWSVDDPAVASVDAAGHVLALSPGATTVRAASDGRSGACQLKVPAKTVARVEVTPASATLEAGASLQLSARAYAADGSMLEGRPVAWASSAPSIATVDGSGLAKLLAAGTAVISATIDEHSGTSQVVVTAPPPPPPTAPAPPPPSTTPPLTVAKVSVAPASVTGLQGSTATLTASAYDANGNLLSGISFTWASANANVAAVNNGTVALTAPGSTTISASAGGFTGSAAVTVTPMLAASVTVAPTTVSILAGGTAQLTATAYDAAGNPMTGRTVTWTVDAPAVAGVSATGLVTAVAAGQAIVTATVDGRTASAQVTVTAPPPPPPPPPTVARVTVAPSAVTGVQGTTATLTATAYDSAGQTMSGVTFSWTSASPAIATVAAGTVSLLAPGTATVTATAAGFSGSATVTVTPRLAASVTVAPSSASILVGATQQLNATAYDAGGAVLTGRPVTWTVSSATVASVSASGLVTGLAAGVATVTATVDGQTASSQVTVTAPASPPTQPGAFHEPAGMTAFVNDNGSARVPQGLSATDPWSGANGWGNTHTALINDPTNPTGSGHAIEKYWYTGMGTDAAAKPGLISVWHWSSINSTFRPARTLYVRMRVWFSANWPDPNGNLAGMKFFYLKTSKTNSNVLWTSKASDGRLHWAAINRHGAAGNYYFDTWSSGAVLHPLGAWHTVEFLFTMNSALDTPDGRVQMWTDGALVSDRTGVTFVGAADTGSALDFDGIEFYPLRGTVNYTFDRDDQFRLGELYISGK